VGAGKVPPIVLEPSGSPVVNATSNVTPDASTFHADKPAAP